MVTHGHMRTPESKHFCWVSNQKMLLIKVFMYYVQLRKMNITPLAILGVKWPFSKGRGR